MPDERGAFLRALRDDPADVATALVFADWLEEHGDAKRAAFVRLQCRGEATQEAITERTAALCARLGVPKRSEYAIEPTFARGFLDALSIPVQWLLDGAGALADEPLLRKLTVGRVNGWGERLAASPVLGQLTDLEVQAWVSPADAAALAASPHLSGLRSLEIWLGNAEGGDHATLAAFAGGVKRAYPQLSELRIVDLPGCSAATLKQADRRAGRSVAKAVIPMPRLYPIQADFGLWLFAGRFPDGTQVLGDTLCTSTRRRARLFQFDPDGKQIRISVVPIPSECFLPGDEERGWEHTDRFRDHLIRERGFIPGTIRVRGLRDPSGTYGIRCPVIVQGGHVGRPDDPSVRPEDDPDDARGRASGEVYWFKYGAYIFDSGNGWWVGPEGGIEST